MCILSSFHSRMLRLLSHLCFTWGLGVTSGWWLFTGAPLFAFFSLFSFFYLQLTSLLPLAIVLTEIFGFQGPSVYGKGSYRALWLRPWSGATPLSLAVWISIHMCHCMQYHSAAPFHLTQLIKKADSASMSTWVKGEFSFYFLLFLPYSVSYLIGSEACFCLMLSPPAPNLLNLIFFQRISPTSNEGPCPGLGRRG